ncbi:MAG: DUF87 domain-containing protein, partial [Candidatus Woesearchaeota archaeon]
LEGKNIDVYLDLKKLLTKHVAILAKSGAGKSYTVGVLIEEIIQKKVPILIIDPHGEYSTLKYPNEEQKQDLEKFNLKPIGFKNIQEYGDNNLNPELRPLRLNNSLTPSEIMQMIPGKLSNTQSGILYNALKNLSNVNFTTLLFELEKEENNAKWSLINNLEYLNSLQIFSDSYVPYNELIQTGKCSIINLKGISPDIQEIIVFKLLKDLFELRKQDKIAPFFCVIEEAHNYCPERSFGETRSSKIIRTIASEGRKFGLGLCVISQRPARVDKSVLSQCTTQIIMKITNPNDLKAVSNSVEGINYSTEQELVNLPIGSALITGIVDMPLLVNIRPRLSKHGGNAKEILEDNEKEISENILEKINEFENKELLPIIKPKLSQKDIILMSEKEIEKIDNELIPAYLFLCQDKIEYNLLIEAIEGNVIVSVDEFLTKKLPEIKELNTSEIRLLHAAYLLKEFNIDELIKKTNLSDIKYIQELIKKGLIEKYKQENKEKYKLSDNYIFSNLSKYAIYSKIEFLDLNYSIKHEKKISIDKIKEKLSNFTKIKDQRECFILRYDVKYK